MQADIAIHHFPPSSLDAREMQGFGLTLGTINALGVLTSVLQAIPSLQLQRLTIIIWMVARFFMYSRLVLQLPRPLC